MLFAFSFPNFKAAPWPNFASHHEGQALVPAQLVRLRELAELHHAGHCDPCIFFNAAQGCRRGHMCEFWNSVEIHSVFRSGCIISFTLFDLSFEFQKRGKSRRFSRDLEGTKQTWRTAGEYGTRACTVLRYYTVFDFQRLYICISPWAVHPPQWYGPPPSSPPHPTTAGEDHLIHTLGTPDMIYILYTLYVQSIQILYRLFTDSIHLHTFHTHLYIYSVFNILYINSMHTYIPPPPPQKVGPFYAHPMHTLKTFYICALYTLYTTLCTPYIHM